VSIKTYILEHWKGNFSLAKSYWLNFILIPLLSIIILGILIPFIKDAKPQTYISIILLTTAPIPMIWGGIGAWRSASMHKSNTGKNFWSTVVHILVVINFLYLFVDTIKKIPTIKEVVNIALNSSSQKIPPYQIRILNHGKEIEVKGGIRLGLLDELKKNFKIHPNIRAIHLNSGGGILSESLNIFKYIKEKDIITYSSTGCYSACVNIFIAGRERLLNKNAQLGLHRGGFPGLNDTNFIIANWKLKDFLVSNGVSEVFSNKVIQTPHDEVWKPSHKQLLEANIVDRIVNGDEFAMTETSFSPKNKKVKMGQEALASLFKAMKKYEPKRFHNTSVLYQSLLEDGTKKNLREKIVENVTATYKRACNGKNKYYCNELNAAFIPLWIMP
jgi:hypothetical protein